MGRNTFKIDTAGMDSIMMRLARLEHESAKDTIEQALTEVAVKINADTRAALAPQHLPAHRN